LADVFISSIGCILILLIVTNTSRRETTEIPQADVIYLCQSVSERPEPDDLGVSNEQGALTYQLKRVYPSRADARLTPLPVVREQLRRIETSDSLSVRLQLIVPPQTPECAEDVSEKIEGLNQAYDDVMAQNRPASYILFDVVRRDL
jgi:hypothetical protein